MKNEGIKNRVKKATLGIQKRVRFAEGFDICERNREGSRGGYVTCGQLCEKSPLPAEA